MNLMIQNALDAGVVDEITYSTARDVVVGHTNDNGSGLVYSEPVYVQKRKMVIKCMSCHWSIN